MTSRGHVIFVHVTQSVTLECRFRAPRFSLFDNPVVWTKTQRGEQRERPVPVNILSNIVAPFLDTGRLSVSFVPPGDRSYLYRVALRLRGTNSYFELRRRRHCRSTVVRHVFTRLYEPGCNLGVW